MRVFSWAHDRADAPGRYHGAHDACAGCCQNDLPAPDKHSDLNSLKQIGLDPTTQPNILILTHDNIVSRFVPSNLLKREDLDPGVLACIDAKDACRGWAITVSRVQRARTGGFWLDFTNFRRRTETTGWRFNALILLVNDTVVYRAWGGQPNVREVEVNTNPLGPLQELGPALITNH